MISSYATAIVDEVIDKTNETSVNFDTYSTGIQAKMTVNKDDDNYTYSFKLDGKDIEAKDLQQNDVLNIAYDTTGSFRDSNFYDVIVTRNVVDGVKCTSRNDTKGEYTIGGIGYILLMFQHRYPYLQQPYTLYRRLCIHPLYRFCLCT